MVSFEVCSVESEAICAVVNFAICSVERLSIWLVDKELRPKPVMADPLTDEIDIMLTPPTNIPILAV